MNIEEAIEGLNKDVYGLKNFLTDTEKEKWQDAIDTVLNELDRIKRYEELEWQEFNELAAASLELQKKDKVIDKMSEKLVEAHGWFYSEFDNYSKEDWKEYFYKKAGEENDAIGK